MSSTLRWAWDLRVGARGDLWHEPGCRFSCPPVPGRYERRRGQYHQLLVEPLRSGRVVLLPVVPTVIGDVDLGGCRHVRPAGLLCLLADWLPELAQGCAIPGLPCNPTQITVEREGVGASH